MKISKLRGIIAERGTSQNKVAAHLGIAGRTFYRKMKDGSFSLQEAAAMIALLNIENPAEVFFGEEDPQG